MSLRNRVRKKNLNLSEQKANDEVQRIQSDFQIKFDSQEQSISKMNANFIEKMSSFRSCNDELSISLENLKSRNTAGLDETKLSFEKELDELKRANEESKNVIKEQLQAQGTSLPVLSYS